MIAKLCAAALLAVASPVASGKVNSGMPPERFRGNGAAIVLFTDRAGIDAYCGVAEPPNIILACRRELTNGASVLIMPNPCILGESEFYAKLMCHEKGHALGWSGDHEP
jgi:hypothetical protein